MEQKEAMHELAVTEQILDIALKAAKEQNAVRIRAIRVRMGPFAGIVPECVQMYLDVLAKGTMAEGAQVEARTAPLRVLCRECGRESEITREHIACPFCGSLRLKTLSGREFMVESLEVDVDGDKGSASGDGVESGCKRQGAENTGGPQSMPD